MGSSHNLDRKYIELRHPKLRGQPWEIKSPRSREYNCIAFALHIVDENWQPDPRAGDCYPPGISSDNTLDAWVACFKKFGFKRCSDSNYKANYEKIVIYFDDEINEPTHVARLIAPGVWHSKMGALEDIHHPLNALNYGNPKYFLQRKIAESPRPDKKSRKRAKR